MKKKKLDLDGHKKKRLLDFQKKILKRGLRECKNQGGAPEDALINCRTQSIYLHERPAARIPG